MRFSTHLLINPLIVQLIVALMIVLMIILALGAEPAMAGAKWT